MAKPEVAREMQDDVFVSSPGPGDMCTFFKMFARFAALASRAIASSSQSLMLTQLAGPSMHAVSSFSRHPLSMIASVQRSMATNSTDIFNIHRDSSENNKNTPFEVSPEDMRRIDEVVARYPPNYKASAVIPVLDLVQQMNGGWLSLTAMNKVASILEMPEASSNFLSLDSIPS